MADLETIVETLRRQREDLEELMSRTASSGSETAELVARIEDLRRRADDTQRRFLQSVRDSDREREGPAR